MIQTITKSDFTTAFHRMGRGKQFSYEGLNALYDYLEMLGEDMGQEIELDVIALCCDYVEYENLKEFQKDYDESYKTMEDIEYHTTLIMIDEDSFIIKQF